MKPSEDKKLLEAVKATAEIYSKQISLAAALMLLVDLDQYESGEVMVALKKCRQELRYFPTVADIVSRLSNQHPGPEEAWAMIPKSEDVSTVWTAEMAEAYGVSRTLIYQDDLVAARVAFIETYKRLISDARSSARKPVWTATMGTDQAGREAVLREAVEKKRITEEQARRLVPDLREEKKNRLALASDSERKAVSDMAGKITKRIENDH